MEIRQKRFSHVQGQTFKIAQARASFSCALLHSCRPKGCRVLRSVGDDSVPSSLEQPEATKLASAKTDGRGESVVKKNNCFKFAIIC